MTQLNELYDAMETMRKNGLVDENLERRVSKREEEIIKKEILPVLTNTIDPALRQVRRELVLVVEYSPDKPLQVKLSRRVNLSQMIGAKVIAPDPQTAHHTIGKTKPHEVKNARSALRITMPDGHVIACQKAAATLVEFVQAVGPIRVRSLGMKVNRVPFVSNTKDAKYASQQHALGGGWLLMTCSNTLTKKRQIEQIAKALGLKVKVEIV